LKFFLQITAIKKTAAEAALDAGRNYMIMPEKKKGAKRYQSKNNPNFKGKRLNLNLLDKIENDIFESNVKELKRSESTDRIKFPIRFTTTENSMLRESNKIRKARRPSVSNLNDFESFKTKQNFKKSKWYSNENDFYDNEREWVRDIWVEWFDEIIPQLDGTIGVKKTKALVENANKKGTQRKPNVVPSNKNSTVNLNPMGPTKTSRSKMGGSVMSKKSLILIDQKNSVVDDDDDDDKPRIVKSPTPYSTYDQVEFINDLNSDLDLENVRLVEREIEKITNRIENRANGMDLCRRGTLYRKLGLIKLGLDDLNRAIEMEPHMLDAYWQRILIYLVQDRKVDAMDSLKFLTNLGHLSKHLRAGAFLAM
jgi:hypothetical protein